MKLLLVVCFSLAIYLVPAQASAIRGIRDASEDVAAAGAAAAAADVAPGADSNENELNIDTEESEEAVTVPLGIVSIKARVIAKDRALCQQLSRYHPHFPKCHEYCKRQEHWIGQCWRESCHCIS
ncbi:uncharacterized protein LOC117903209 [Drosophila subobscura]|uniref:uncharacterized protein LOC117903209 n=1 Tax=Drosophila subobscura TaxID=7241 RepID=UPI00155A3F3A|nr:uncharacterized protein LOC117903209 [Drosophila subobscura]